MCELVKYMEIEPSSQFITYDAASRIHLFGRRIPMDMDSPFECGRCGRGRPNAETVVGDGEEPQIVHLCWDEMVALPPDLSDENIRFGGRVEL